jgi:hypothetical protein
MSPGNNIVSIALGAADLLAFIGIFLTNDSFFQFALFVQSK